jgi:hypothetical protein
MTTTYQRQLNHIFNRPTTEPAWYWQDHWEEGIFDDDPLSAFTFIETLLKDIKTDLSPYSDDQIGLGLEYVFNNANSNLACDFKVAEIHIERKVEAIRSSFALFRDIFNPRCEPMTSAFSKEKSSPLNGICYMFWDICPWSTWIKFTNTDAINQSFMAGLSESDLENMQLPEEVLELMRQQIAQAQKTVPMTPEEIAANVQQQYDDMDAETRGYYEAIAYVMQQCLELDNPACVESGLHGLGHMATFLPDIAVPIIDGYLDNSKHRDSVLLAYAQEARTGMIL